MLSSDLRTVGNDKHFRVFYDPGGGANAGDRFALGHGLVVDIPTTRAINPVTRVNWQHTGVKPDLEAPAAAAQQVAYVAILRERIAKPGDAKEITDLRRLLARVEKDETEPPVYEMRH